NERGIASMLALILIHAVGSYDRRACGIGKTGDNFRGHRLRFNRAGPLRMRSRPDTLLKSIERKLTCFENPMAHSEATASPFADFALDHDLVIEAARDHEPRSDFDDRHAHDAVFFSHRRRRQSSSLEQPAGAGVEDDQILRIENDSGGIALTPFDAQRAAIHQHGVPYM